VLALLLGCASAPVVDIATQRFDAAFRAGSEKFAAGDLKQAAVAFKQAESMAALYDRRELRLRALFSLGAVAATQEDDLAALQAYTLALAEAHGLADAHSEAVARAGVAEAQRRAADYTDALQNFDLALAPDALRQGSPERQQARMGRALVWNATGRAAAMDELQALEAQVRAGNSGLLSAVLANQAVLLRDTGSVPTAIAKAEEALELDRRQSSPYALAADLELLGTLYHLSGQHAEALASVARALRIVHSTGQLRSAQRLQQLQHLYQ
jgi:tetratricopeptide (TPR) repeat protein